MQTSYVDDDLTKKEGNEIGADCFESRRNHGISPTRIVTTGQRNVTFDGMRKRRLKQGYSKVRTFSLNYSMETSLRTMHHASWSEHTVKLHDFHRVQNIAIILQSICVATHVVWLQAMNYIKMVILIRIEHFPDII